MAQSSLGVVITPDMAGDDATADCQYGLPCQHAKMLWNEHRTNEVQYPSLFQPHSTSCAASTTLEKSLSHALVAYDAAVRSEEIPRHASALPPFSGGVFGVLDFAVKNTLRTNGKAIIVLKELSFPQGFM